MMPNWNGLRRRNPTRYNGRIAAIGSLAGAQARRRIDASGLIVAPGFIDIHNHSDYTILREPRSESMIRQGVTTMVLGESHSAGPVKPGQDERSRAVLRQMQADEVRHAQNAQARGGIDLPFPIPQLMHASSMVMKTVAYRV